MHSTGTLATEAGLCLPHTHTHTLVLMVLKCIRRLISTPSPCAHQSRWWQMSQYLLFVLYRRELETGARKKNRSPKPLAAPLIALPPSRSLPARRESSVESCRPRRSVFKGAPSGQVGGAGDAAASEFLCSTFGIASDGAEIPPPAPLAALLLLRPGGRSPQPSEAHPSPLLGSEGLLGPWSDFLPSSSDLFVAGAQQPSPRSQQCVGNTLNPPPATPCACEIPLARLPSSSLAWDSPFFP